MTGEEDLLNHLGVILFEYLGEEYPEVLGSILGALRSIVDVVGMEDITPPIRDLLPRLTPILQNRHEKVSLLFLYLFSFFFSLFSHFFFSFISLSSFLTNKKRYKRIVLI